MLMPKRVKYRRVQRGRMKGKATRGNGQGGFNRNGQGRPQGGFNRNNNTRPAAPAAAPAKEGGAE